MGETSVKTGVPFEVAYKNCHTLKQKVMESSGPIACSDELVVGDTDAAGGDITITMPPLSQTPNGGVIYVRAIGPDNVFLEPSSVDPVTSLDDVSAFFGGEIQLSGLAKQFVRLAKTATSSGQIWRVVTAGSGPSGGGLIDSSFGIHGFAFLQGMGQGLALPPVAFTFTPWVGPGGAGSPIVIGAPWLTSTGSQFLLGSAGFPVTYRLVASFTFTATLGATISAGFLEGAAAPFTVIPGGDSGGFIGGGGAVLLRGSLNAIWNPTLPGQTLSLGFSSDFAADVMSVHDVQFTISKVGL